MSTTPTHDQRIARMTFASVFPMYLAKVEKKGRTREELHQVIEWLTGFNEKQQQDLIKAKLSFAPHQLAGVERQQHHHEQPRTVDGGFRHQPAHGPTAGHASLVGVYRAHDHVDQADRRDGQEWR